MEGKFVIFSTEQGASLAPDEYDDYDYIARFDRDPIATGSYNPHAGTTVRGSVIPTLGGVVIQDFGVRAEDQRITISDEAALYGTTVEEIKEMYEMSDTSFYFTDGYVCYLVKFSRPKGFSYKRNLIAAHHGYSRYDYEIELVVLGTSIEGTF